MNNAEITDVEVVSEKPKRNGHGGARPGAGRKREGYKPPPEKVDFDKAKARHEYAKAALAELELRRRMGDVVSRAAVRDASAHALASVAQSLRSVPDDLERKFGLTPEQAEAIGKRIDEVLNDLADEFEMLVVQEDPADDDDDEGDNDE